MGFYMGDANPNKPFRKLGAAFDMTFRWNINYRWALKCGLSTATMRGESSGLGLYYPSAATYSFKRQLVWEFKESLISSTMELDKPI